MSSTNDLHAHDEELVRHLTQAQRGLYGYILSLVPNPDTASDILQETNVIIWRKASEYSAAMNFMGWACRVAHFQVLAYLRDKTRDRHLFEDDLIKVIAAETEVIAATSDARREALLRCMKGLAPRDQKLIHVRYNEGRPVKWIAEQMQKSVNAVSRSLYRIRNLLLNCIDRRLLDGGSQ